LRILVLIALLIATTAEAAPARLTEAEVRAFVARQSKAWNAGDLAAYFALFTRDARFTDQARSKDGRLVPYGTSTVAEARAQAKRSLSTTRVSETTMLRQVQIAPDGKSARVVAAEDTTLTTGARTRRLCAERVMTLIATPAGPRSKGQTDTITPCR